MKDKKYYLVAIAIFLFLLPKFIAVWFTDYHDFDNSKFCDEKKQ